MHYSQGDFCYPPCCIIPTVTVGSTVTTPPGTRARVTASPTPCGVELDFAIPRGNPGPAGTRGPTGPQGPEGPQGPQGPEPCSQKLSSLPNLKILSAGIPIFLFQISNASSSSTYTLG